MKEVFSTKCLERRGMKGAQRPKHHTHHLKQPRSTAFHLLLLRTHLLGSLVDLAGVTAPASQVRGVLGVLSITVVKGGPNEMEKSCPPKKSQSLVT